MANVIFYEKPGCINNTRQKKLLQAAGHEVDARNLLEESWTIENLRPYFGSLPVAEWFNSTAPAVKAGTVDPETLTEHDALALMVDMPLLIRRPLMQVAGEYHVGFDVEAVHAWIGLKDIDTDIDVETCVRTTGTTGDVSTT
jgi:nitrogenase-associated protein